MNATADPGAVWRVINGFSSYWLVVAALELGVFEELAGGERSVEELAATTASSAHHLAVLLDALAAIGVVTAASRGYASTPESDTFLVRGAPRFMGDLVVHSPGRWSNWTQLAQTVRTGAPPEPVDDDAAFYATLVRSTFPTQYATAQRTIALLDPDLAASVRTVLDIGAGAAPWAIAFLQAQPAANAVVNDLPGIIEQSEDSLEHHGVRDRATLLPGDYRVATFAAGTYDVVVLGHVCRGEGATGAPTLIERAAAALAPGGLLVITDYFVDDDRSGSVNARLLGATMMANTASGATFTTRQFRDWVAGAGLHVVDVLEPLPNSPVMLARKEAPR